MSIFSNGRTAVTSLALFLMLGATRLGVMSMAISAHGISSEIGQPSPNTSEAQLTKILASTQVKLDQFRATAEFPGAPHLRRFKSFCDLIHALTDVATNCRPFGPEQNYQILLALRARCGRDARGPSKGLEFCDAN